VKKSSSDAVNTNLDSKSIQTWTPRHLGAESKPVVPSFVIPEGDESVPSFRKLGVPVLKNTHLEMNQFAAWFPADLMSSAAPVGFPDAVETWLKKSNSPLDIDPREEQTQQMIQQAQKQAEIKILLEQEQQIDSAKHEAQKLLSSAEAISKEIHQLRDQIISNNEESILALVMDVSKALFSEGFTLEKDVLEKVILKALRDAKELGNLTLYLHPEDQELLDPYWPEGLLGSTNEIIIRPDQEIQRGGCLIEGELGQVDARVSAKFQAIQTALQQANEVEISQDPKGGQE